MARRRKLTDRIKPALDALASLEEYDAKRQREHDALQRELLEMDAARTPEQRAALADQAQQTKRSALYFRNLTMDINDIFPSRFLAAADLKGREVTATIADVTVEQLNADDERSVKPIIAFKGTDKTLACNKTNASTIAALYGADTDDWIGKRITIVPTFTDYNGRRVACIRVNPVKPAAPTTNTASPAQRTPPPAPLAAPVSSPQGDAAEPDDIPF